MNSYGTISAILRQKGSEVWSICLDATMLDAIKLLSEKNLGALLVVDGDRPAGIVSERDYTRKVELKGKVAKDVLVREVLSGELITVHPGHTVDECMRLMSKHRIRHLPVLDKGKVVGIVSIGDLVNWIISAQTETIIQLQSYITGQYPSGEPESP